MNALLSAAVAPRLFKFLSRGKTEMPANYLPSARGVMFAGEDILNAIGHVPGSYRPRGWRRCLPGDYRKRAHKHQLVVRQCGNPRSVHWTIERIELWIDKGVEALVLASRHGEPIWARSFQAAMRVAEYCHPIARPPVFASWEVARAPN
jgi:hypothetical protein